MLISIKKSIKHKSGSGKPSWAGWLRESSRSAVRHQRSSQTRTSWRGPSSDRIGAQTSHWRAADKRSRWPLERHIPLSFHLLLESLHSPNLTCGQKRRVTLKASQLEDGSAGAALLLLLFCRVKGQFLKREKFRASFVSNRRVSCQLEIESGVFCWWRSRMIGVWRDTWTSSPSSLNHRLGTVSGSIVQFNSIQFYLDSDYYNTNCL